MTHSTAAYSSVFHCYSQLVKDESLANRSADDVLRYLLAPSFFGSGQPSRSFSKIWQNAQHQVFPGGYPRESQSGNHLLMHGKADCIASFQIPLVVRGRGEVWHVYMLRLVSL